MSKGNLWLFVPPEPGASVVRTAEKVGDGGAKVGRVLGVLDWRIPQTSRHYVGVYGSSALIFDYRNEFRVACASEFAPSLHAKREDGNPFLGDDAFEVSFETALIFPGDGNLAARASGVVVERDRIGVGGRLELGVGNVVSCLVGNAVLLE